jgi:hypothetical protein
MSDVCSLKFKYLTSYKKKALEIISLALGDHDFPQKAIDSQSTKIKRY